MSLKSSFRVLSRACPQAYETNIVNQKCTITITPGKSLSSFAELVTEPKQTIKDLVLLKFD